MLNKLISMWAIMKLQNVVLPKIKIVFSNSKAIFISKYMFLKNVINVQPLNLEQFSKYLFNSIIYILTFSFFFNFKEEKTEGEEMWMKSSDASMVCSEEVASRLRVDCRTGLWWKEAELRMQLVGHNEFSVKEEDPPWKKYIEQVTFFLYFFFLKFYFRCSFSYFYSVSVYYGRNFN